MELLNKITLKQLRYFVTVAEIKNFRKASAILNISQPPLTHQIKSLEESLGVLLFDRRGKKLELTVAGENLLVSAKQLLNSMSGSLEHIRAIGRGQEGVIRVGMTNDFVYSPILNRINDFSNLNSRLPVEIYVNTSPTLFRYLDANIVDFIMTVPNADLHQHQFIEHALPSSQILALVPEKNHLADRRELSIEDLHAETIINFPEESKLPIAEICHRLMNQTDIDFHAGYITANSSVAARLASEQRGVAFASEYSIPNPLQNVVTLPFTPPLYLEHRLLHTKKYLHPAIFDLIDYLIEA